MKDYIYLYGQVLATHSFLIKGEFPKPDGCGDIQERHFHVGGETGTAAAILASLGCQVKIGGTHIGAENADLIRDYFPKKGIDSSELVYDEEFGGVIDYVFITGQDRTCFGEWGNLYQRHKAWYEPISEQSVRECVCVGFDPFLDNTDMRVVEYCMRYEKQYATIDCEMDSEYNRHCEINALSQQYLKGVYGENADLRELHRRYTEYTEGLVIITCGENEILYGRKGEEIKTWKPYHVPVVSTLGAGDSFKAGTVYGLANGYSDDEIVRYASAVAGVAVGKYPICENPPTGEEVGKLIG